jgi:hypothetical protein
MSENYLRVQAYNFLYPIWYPVTVKEIAVRTNFKYGALKRFFHITAVL